MITYITTIYHKKPKVFLFVFSVILFIFFSYFKSISPARVKAPFVLSHVFNNRTKTYELTKNIDDFLKNGIVFSPRIEQFIEKDNFNAIENSDFSQGLSHWTKTGINEKTLNQQLMF